MARTLPVSSKLGFGVGQVSESIVSALFNTFILFFYNQVVGVSATLTGIAIAVAMVADAVSDPLTGSISDRLKSRWGRRLPLMAAAAIPLAISVVGVLNPPADMSEGFYFGWLVFFAVATRLFLTLYSVPHMALGAEMAQDYTDRTRIFSYSQAFGTIGTAAFTFLMYTLFFPTPEDGSHGLLNAEGYTGMSAIAAIGIVSAILLCVAGTLREVPHLPAWTPEYERFGPARLFRELKQALASRSYRVLLAGMIVILFVIGVEMTFMTYIYVHFWELETEQMRWIPPAMLAGLPLSVILIPLLTQRFDKKHLLITIGIVVQINLNILILLRLFSGVLPDNGDEWIFRLLIISSFINGLTAPALLITFYSMFADVADELDYRTGSRQEGIIYSARSFCSKSANGLATIAGGLALDLISFPRGGDAEVSAETVYHLGMVAAPPTLTIGLMSMTFFLFYSLSRERMQEIESVIQQRRNDARAPSEG